MKIFKEFEGKTAFVTGAASGMGQAAAICFGGLGCRVAVAARNPKALETVQTIRENGGKAIFVECDVTDDDSVRKAIETTVKTFGSLDYAFNNAGCGADGKNIPFAPLTEVAESDWQKVINTNLTGVFHCMKYELLQMQKQGRGAIVNNASIGGLRMAPGFGAYGPSKAGVIAICPGPTEGTGLMQDSIDAGAQDAEFLKNYIIPMKKMGTTKDIADAVVFLCSDMAGHITGMAMPVCGGMQM